MEKPDLIIVGGGPCGLACAIEAGRKGLNCLILEKGNIGESIRRYPKQMTFFSTAENIAVGGLPFAINKPKATREEALNYYRMAADYFGVKILVSTRVERVEKTSEGFRVTCADGRELISGNVVLATGYFDVPRPLGIKGEDMAHVSRYYSEPFGYTYSKVVIAGGGNTAVETALDLYRHGAEVTLVIRKDDFKSGVKYWLLPDIRNRIKEGRIKALFNSTITEISEKEVLIRDAVNGKENSLAADFVLLLTGYLPDAAFLRAAGIKVDPETLIPEFNPETFETNVKGLYLAGTVVSGIFTEKIFIENGRLHGVCIVEDILKTKN